MQFQEPGMQAQSVLAERANLIPQNVRKQRSYARTIAGIVIHTSLFAIHFYVFVNLGFAVQVIEPKHGVYEFMMTFLGAIIGFLGSLRIFCIFPNPYQTVSQGQVGLLCKYGKCAKMVDPGLHRVNPLTENIVFVNVKLTVAEIPKQTVLTKDNVNIEIDSVLTYTIADPYVATFLIQNLHASLIERTMTTLRQSIGLRTLQECIENRQALSAEIYRVIVPTARKWGATIEAIMVKDISLPKDLMESLSAAANQRRQGESKVIAAQAEVEAAKLLRKASDILNSSAAMQMRYLDTLHAMSNNSGSSIIFMPLSGDYDVTSSPPEVPEKHTPKK